MKERENGWRSGDILRAAALVLGLYLLLRLLWVAYPIVFVSFLGVLFGLAVAKGADYLERLRIPRGIGSSLVALGFVGVLVGIGFWIAPTLREQTRELRTALPQAIERAEDWLNRQGGGLLGQLMPEPQPQAEARPATPATPATVAPAGPPRPPQQDAQKQPGPPRTEPAPPSRLPATLSGQLDAVARHLFSVLSSTIAVLTGLILILFLAIYIGADPALYRRGLLHLFPHRVRRRADEVLTAVGITLRNWLTSQLVAMLVIGIVTTIVLKLLRVQAALPLGIIAGLLEFIPIVGPVLSAIPAVAMGFLDSPQKALFVALAYVGIQFFENHLLIPLLMKEGVDLPPALTLIGLAVMGIVFGFLGMLVAVPLLAAILVTVKLLYVEGVVGDEVKTVLDAE
ncbi:MAG TPA: AI-2E family transporter [Thermoanaerobaculia bacterium]|nr:AI-2E family transporter [Thermoanaerobaculia bacterium]